MTVDIVEKVLGTGPYLIIGLAGALLGWIMIEQRHARVIAVWLLAVAVVAISPLGLAVLDLIGLSESIRWRMIWLVPVPALLGALAAGAAARIGRGPGIPLVGLVGAATVLAGLPIWSAENGVSLGPPSHKWPIDVQEDHARVASVARDGDVLGVPESTGAMVAALSGVYWSVNPRGSYTSSMDVQDGFCGLERSVVNQYARGLRTLDEEAVGSLERLGVTVLQFAEGVAPDRRSLAALGFEPTEQRDVLRRDPPNAASPCRTPTD